MSRPSAASLLRGKIVRKTAAPGTSSASRSLTPQAASATTTVTNLGGGVKDATGKISEYSSMEDQCPVCKSDRYLNPKLRLLVSACYHKMCESCIDRLFTLGPAPCPVCSKTLRKLAFMPQTFEDLTVEKEVTVRRRIAKDFNKRREDFPDLRSFNDYLEEVEDITFNLINDIDIPGTEARIQKFRTENAALIETNIHRDEAYATALREQEEADRRQREAHARELARLEEEERQLRVQERQQVIDQLGSGEGDPAKVVARARAEHAKRMRAKALDSSSAESATASALQATRALRARALQPNIPDPPHVPLQDDWYAYNDLYTLRSEGYYDPVSERVRADEDGTKRAGGYKIEEAWERALRCAVAGLDITPLTGAEEGSSINVGGQAISSGVDVVMANA